MGVAKTEPGATTGRKPYEKPAITPRPVFDLPQEEILSQGHLACPGCGAAITMRIAMKLLGRNTVVVCPACCWAVIDGPYPHSATGVPFLHVAFETAAMSAAGVRAALDVQGLTDVNVVAWAGDGGTFDIGLQAISACAERNENIIYVCYDNEAYMNTGIQRSSATPINTWTTTTPWGATKKQTKKDIDAIMAAHRIPYLATASPSFPDDMIAKFKKAIDMKGFRFLHVMCPCTAGWKHEEKLTIELGRLAVHTKIFPLYEVHDGVKLDITVQPKGGSIREFFKHQGRYAKITEEQIEVYQKEVDRHWADLVARSRREH
jgi:pyruvate ferredoxin oxidoreductase beta subunit/2-oxoisovalerate ferredoxin oxidoreductase beta subunit